MALEPTILSLQARNRLSLWLRATQWLSIGAFLTWSVVLEGFILKLLRLLYHSLARVMLVGGLLHITRADDAG